MNIPSERETLRPALLARRLLTDYGVEPPGAIVEALNVFHKLRTAPIDEPSFRTIGALALDDSEVKAAKALATAEHARTVRRAALYIAAERARSATVEHADSIISGVLTSPVVLAAVKELAEVAPGVRPDVPRDPIADDSGRGLGDVIGASRLKQAEAVIRQAAARLDAHDALGTTFVTDAEGQATSPEVGLIWLDPSGITDRAGYLALRHALGGWRKGHSTHRPYVTQNNGSTLVPVRDTTPLGITSATAAAVPGVAFAIADSVAEFNRRLALLDRGLNESTPDAPRDDKPRVAVL
jgi:hypothetical protein